MAGNDEGKGDDSTDPNAKGEEKNTPQFMIDHPKGSSTLVNEVYAEKMQIRRIK